MDLKNGANTVAYIERRKIFQQRLIIADKISFAKI